MNFSGPIRPDVFSQNVERYEAWYEKHRLLYLSELKLISRLEKFPRDSLEIGVGTGRFASQLNIGFGLDPSVPMLVRAKRRGIKVVAGVGEKLPFKESSFSSALIAITICFVLKPEKVLKESFRILKPGGHIVIAFIERNSPWGIFYSRKESPFYKIASFYSLDEIMQMINSAGFVLKKTAQTLFVSPAEEERLEEPEEGTGRGSFIGLLAEKPV